MQISKRSPVNTQMRAWEQLGCLTREAGLDLPTASSICLSFECLLWAGKGAGFWQAKPGSCMLGLGRSELCRVHLPSPTLPAPPAGPPGPHGLSLTIRSQPPALTLPSPSGSLCYPHPPVGARGGMGSWVLLPQARAWVLWERLAG